MEKWKEINGYDGDYLVSDKGKVLSLKNKKKPRELKLFLSVNGYERVNLMKEGKTKQVFVHRLVANAFLGEVKEGYSVNHKDGKKENNNLENLEIITHKQNISHSIHVLGNKINPVLMLDKETFEPIREFRNMNEASKVMGIDAAGIWKVCNWERNFAGGYSWVMKDEYNEEIASNKKKRINKGLRRRTVYQIDEKTNGLIKSYEGVRVAEREIGINTIKHALAGITKTAGGYRWSYVKPN